MSGAFQSTPPARGATGVPAFGIADIRISIHAPREGGDRAFLYAPARQQIFQSTPPARGATLFRGRLGQLEDNFNPRPPRGGRLPVTPLVQL